MGVTKDLFDIATALTPFRRWLANRKEADERRRIIASFSPEFLADPEHLTQLRDYYEWNEETNHWTAGDGDLYATSYREFAAYWSRPSLYCIYESGLLRYINSGGTVNRTIVVGDEYFDPQLQLLLVRTAMRQTILGFEPLVAHRLDIAGVSHTLGIDCNMLTIVNNRVAYFPRLDPAPCMIRTTNKKFIGRAWETYRDLAHHARPFQRWLSGCSFADRVRDILPEIEEECRLITEYAGASRSPKTPPE